MNDNADKVDGLYFPSQYESIKHGLTLVCDQVDPEPDRGGLMETPARAANAWMHWTGGYHINPADLLKTFEDGAENYDEMVLVKDIRFNSHCEHHMAAIWGVATIAYIPTGKIVGLSKMGRLVDAFARRLQTQERLTSQIANTLFESAAKPRGVAVRVRARHMCMESRGLCKHGHETVTQALLGVFKENDAARAEFSALAHSSVPL